MRALHESHSSYVAVALLLLTLAAARPSAQDETNIVNQRLSVSNQEETLNIGNEETNNYHLEENNYQPTQNTHVTVNVGKIKGKNLSKMRKFRPPTTEEMGLKLRIMEVYEYAKEEAKSTSGAGGKNFLYLQHLGRILNALNPKYIATKRVWREAFADPANPGAEVVAPERDLESIYGSDAPAIKQLDLSSGEGHPPVIEQLDHLAKKFKETITWDKRFVQELFEIPDSAVSPSQLAFKKLLQCLTFPLFCNKMVGSGPKNFVPNEEVKSATSAALERAPLKERLVRMPPSPKRGSPNTFMPPPQQGPLPQQPPRRVEPNLAPPPPPPPPSQDYIKDEPEELDYEPAPPKPAPPLHRRRFAPQRREPPPDAFNRLRQRLPPDEDYLPAQQYQQAPMQHYPQGRMQQFGYHPNARMQPQTHRSMQRSPPPMPAEDEFVEELIESYDTTEKPRRKFG